MRISDWSSDVCSSVLQQYDRADPAHEQELAAFECALAGSGGGGDRAVLGGGIADAHAGGVACVVPAVLQSRMRANPERLPRPGFPHARREIGIASGRERVCQYG